MNVVAWLVVGLVAGVVAERVLRPLLAQPALTRTNYRDASVQTSSGVVIVVAVALSAALAAVVAATDVDLGAAPDALALTLAAVTGFGLLGLLDDLLGNGDRRGFRGHVRALARGELTTGLLKLVGGGLLALVLASRTGDDLPALLVRAAVIALAANLANLLDRAPARTLKVAVLSFAALWASTRGAAGLMGPAAAVGSSLALVPGDLDERTMLGDTGANALGAAVGLGVVLATTTTTCLVVALVLAALNAASEVVSFSRVIERTPPLRWLDRLGSPHR